MNRLEMRFGKQTIKPLVPIARQWQTPITTYPSKVRKKTDRGDVDAPYWYNEKANVELPAAASRCEGIPALDASAADQLVAGDPINSRLG